MSLSIKAVDRLFERMAATYGAQWTRQWQDVPMTDVKAAWAHELTPFENSLSRIAWALENLPTRCPNVIEFKALCRLAPMPDAPRLPEPKADPERVRAELAKLGELRASVGANQGGGKAWAHRIIHRHQMCERINPTTLRLARQALGLEPA
jgi:hypothetical protein